MEFVDGESLGQRIERDGRLPEDEALRLITQVCQGLYRAHKQGLVHRDVKPDNILLNREGQAKLTDLGLVKDAAEDNNLTKTGRGLGTPHFMAPEQFKSAKNADLRCDIYSVGATLYNPSHGAFAHGHTHARKMLGQQRGRPVRNGDAHVLRRATGFRDYACAVGFGERECGRPVRRASASIATGSSRRKRCRHFSAVRS